MKQLDSILIAVMLVACGQVTACEKNSVALRYLSAIEAMNWAAMRTYLAEDAIYTDPTMAHYDREPIALAGADSIVAFWSSSSTDSGTGQINYSITSCMETAGFHVVNLDIDIKVSGKFWNVAKDVINIPGRVVSVIRVDDGRVTEHHDYVEYAAADHVVAELREQYGAYAE